MWLRKNDGTFTKGHEPPEHPGFFGMPFIFAGASADLSHTYCAGHHFGVKMWAPGVGPGIYEFAGTGNSGLPNRIDLDNYGNPISNCIGGASITGSAFFNAFTSDGKTVLRSRWVNVKENRIRDPGPS